MRLPFVLLPENLFESSVCHLPENQRHHLRAVLRKNGAIEAEFFDGKGHRRFGTIKPDNSIIFSGNIDQLPQPQETSLMLGIPKSKSIELIVQKATEAGISRLILKSSDFSVAKPPTLKRLNQIIQSAAVQSRNYFLPLVEISDIPILETKFNSHSFYATADLNESAVSTNQLMQCDFSNKNSFCFICGPEGGFSARESQYLASNSTVIELGTTVLRTETAAIFGCLLLKMLTTQSETEI